MGNPHEIQPLKTKKQPRHRRLRKKDKIHHPKSKGSTHSNHFAAFGTARSATNVTALLTNQNTLSSYEGWTILQPTADTGFWIVQFVLNHISVSDLYTLEVFDADTGVSIDTTTDISIAEDFALILITYPHPGDTPPPQFAAYGTSDTLGNMQGSFNNVMAMVTQASGPPDWVLHCQTNGVAGNFTTLTVSQPMGIPSVPPPASVTFKFGRT